MWEVYFFLTQNLGLTLHPTRTKNLPSKLDLLYSESSAVEVPGPSAAICSSEAEVPPEAVANVSVAVGGGVVDASRRAGSLLRWIDSLTSAEAGRHWSTLLLIRWTGWTEDSGPTKSKAPIRHWQWGQANRPLVQPDCNVKIGILV